MQYLSKFNQSLLTHKNIGFNLFLPLIFIGLVLLIMPISDVFQFDTDEGQELVKAMLYHQGFTLYCEIWTDQPPLLTFLLATGMKFWGNSVVAARMLILALATLLVWTFSQLLRYTVGDFYAIIGTILLIFSANFLRFSVSVMIGLPAMAFALLSLYFLYTAFQQNNSYLPIFSGVALAISFQFKVITIFLVPLMVLYWVNIAYNGLFQVKTYLPLIKWLLALILTYLIIGFSLNALQFDQFFQFHVQEGLKDKFVNENSLYDVTLFYLQELDYVLLGLVGVGAILRQSRTRFKHFMIKLWFGETTQKLLFFPVLWVILVTFLLVNHKPIWYHHYLLLSIPFTWLATVGVKVAVSQFKKQQISVQWRQKNWGKLIPFQFAAIALLFTIAVFPVKLTILHLQNNQFIQQSQVHWEILKTVKQYQPQTQWLFTDIPIYAAYSNINVPPEIATLSRKRIASEEMTPEVLFSLVNKYNPEQVILGRFPEVKSPLKPYLQENFIKVHDQESNIHYIQSKLL